MTIARTSQQSHISRRHCMSIQTVISVNMYVFFFTSGKPGVTLEKLDPRTLDVVLTEITLLSSRTELYLRFIRRRVSVSSTAKQLSLDQSLMI